jgi:HPt (histidine-containing phosphotransfer) domain-containing protein
MIELFLTESQAKLEAMAAAQPSHDFKTMRRSCHTLKSSAGILECSELEHLAEVLEQLASEEKPHQFAERFPELEALVERIQDCCQNYLQKHEHNK